MRKISTLKPRRLRSSSFGSAAPIGKAAAAYGKPNSGFGAGRRLPHRLEGDFRPLWCACRTAAPPRSCRSSASAPLPTKRPFSNRRPAKSCPLRRGSIARISPDSTLPLCRARRPGGAATAPPINMAFTLFAHHAEGGAPSPFYVAIRLPDHSAMITSNCRAHGLHHFVFSHDLIQKVGNFLGSCRSEAACPQRS
jgi:hypothetical protein